MKYQVKFTTVDGLDGVMFANDLETATVDAEEIIYLHDVDTLVINVFFDGVDGWMPVKLYGYGRWFD